MLEMREMCEKCEAELPATAIDAVICSYECTFCASCSDAMNGVCPNCAGQLTARPTRVA